MQREHGLEFPLVYASAEGVPLADESFDLVVSAADWAERWPAEEMRKARKAP
jgi:hypothetical protein